VDILGVRYDDKLLGYGGWVCAVQTIGADASFIESPNRNLFATRLLKSCRCIIAMLFIKEMEKQGRPGGSGIRDLRAKFLKPTTRLKNTGEVYHERSYSHAKQRGLFPDWLHCRRIADRC
jgi:hypothetical protein